MGPADPVRLLHFTDPHLFRAADGELRGTVTFDTLNAVIDDFLARAWPADLAIMTGDVVQDDSAAAYERFVESAGRLGLPVHCVPGNHDVRDLMRTALGQPPFHYCDTVNAGNWAITGIDSCVDGKAGGRVSQNELARLSALLRDTSAEHVLVCLHHPPLPMQSRWLDSVGLDNAEAFLATVADAGNVRGAVFGHVHQAFDETVDGIRVIGTPSTCAQFLPRSDEFALDSRPPAYRRLILRPDGSMESELMWLEGDE